MKKNQFNKTFDLKISSTVKNRIIVKCGSNSEHSEQYNSIDSDNPTFNIKLKLGDQLIFLKVCALLETKLNFIHHFIV